MLLARMAEAVYWAGRYLERAEDTARIVAGPRRDPHRPARRGGRRLGAPRSRSRARPPTGAQRPAGGRASAAARRSAEGQVVAYRADRPGQPLVDPVVDLSRPVTTCAGPGPSCREKSGSCATSCGWSLSPDAHHVGHRDAAGALAPDGDRRDPAQINGRDAGHHATRRGAGLLPHGPASRAGRDHVPHALGPRRGGSCRTRPGGDVYNEVHQMALLRSLASLPAVPSGHAGRPDAASTLRFLLQDEAFPEAVSACLGELRDLVKALPRNEPILAAATDTAVLVADAPVGELTPHSLAGVPGRARKGDRGRP